MNRKAKLGDYTWTYRFVGDGMEIASVSPKPTGAVAIPDMLEGRAVTSIGNWLFGNCSGLTSVMIPESVTRIGELAFTGCSGLREVTIPDSVKIIERWAFSRCSKLMRVIMPKHFKGILDRRVFDECSPGLEIVYI